MDTGLRPSKLEGGTKSAATTCNLSQCSSDCFRISGDLGSVFRQNYRTDLAEKSIQSSTSSKHLIRPDGTTVVVAAADEASFRDSLAICSTGAAFALRSLDQHVLWLSLR